MPAARLLPFLLLACVPMQLIAASATASRPAQEAARQDVPAQPGTMPVEAIAKVLVDADRDTVPDRKGEVVRIHGVVTVPTGVMRTHGMQIMVQDTTGGLTLFSRGGPRDLPAGTVVDAWGAVAQYKGAVQLEHARLRVIGRAQVPAPRTLTTAEADRGIGLGRRATIEGTVGDLSLDGYGLMRITGRDRSPLTLYIPPPVTDRFDWKRFPRGSRVVATGVLSIHKANWPYDGGYQLVMSDPSGLQIVGAPPPAWHAWVVPAVGFAFGLFVIGLLVTRFVQHRQRERQRELQTLAALSSAFAAPELDEQQLARTACEVLTAYGITEAAMVQVFDEDGSLRQLAVATADPSLGKALETQEPMGSDWADSESHGRQIEARIAATGLGLLAIHPLAGPSGALGFLIALSPRRRRPSQMQERTLLAAVKLLAMALENRRAQVRARDEQRELQQLVITDELTRLYNRRFLEEYLRVQMPLAHRRGGGLAFLAIDIDHFKRVNDTYGHAAGDRVLAGIAALMREISRESDLPIRIGGEEFLFVIAEHEVDGAMAFAERLRTTVAAHAFAGIVPDDTVRVTVSIGVALFGLHGADAATLLRASDEAMYESKRAGRDRSTLSTRIVSPSIDAREPGASV